MLKHVPGTLLRHTLLATQIAVLLLGSQIAPATAEEASLALKRAGNALRLHGDYEAANLIQTQLVNEYPDRSIGYLFNLNTMVTRLTWNDRQTRFDKQIRRDAAAVFAICKPLIADDSEHYQPYHDCGQAHFALSYLSGIRGEYYDAGRHGKRATQQLERSLELNPKLTDAKMHLGIAYYHADHLPLYLKALSWILWFIPQGNSSKSLPYLEQVIANGDYYRDVAKYLYADLLISEGAAGKKKATKLLEQLIEFYAGNRRMQVRYISLLLEQGLSEETIAAGTAFVNDHPEYGPDDIAASMIRLWVVRAYMSLDNLDKALSWFDEIDIQLFNDANPPTWGATWLVLTEAQMHGLAKRRTKALAGYRSILTTSEDAYVNPVVVLAAERGLDSPYAGPDSGTGSDTR